jgi:hypothetical protein
MDQHKPPSPKRCPQCSSMECGTACRFTGKHSFHDHRDIGGDLKVDRFEIPPAYLDRGIYGSGR